MAYQVQFFCQSHGRGLQEAIAGVQAAVSDPRNGISMEAASEGRSWKSFDLRPIAGGNPTRVVIHYGDETVRGEIRRASLEPDAPDLSAVDMLIDLILSGEVTVGTVRTFWQILVEDFSAVPFDEASGFEASLV